MDWKRIVLGLTLAILVGLVTSVYVYRQLSRAAANKPAALTKVVVAAAPLPIGTALQPNHLRLVDWPSENKLPGMFSRIEECVNRALITPVVENETILDSKLAPREAGAGLAAVIPEGMRAVTVSVNEVIGVAGFVQPGTMVDVLATGSYEGRGTSSTLTRTVLENVRVLAAGQKVEQDREGKPQTVPVITLLVTPQDANKLIMASMQGRIQLALRNTIDTKKADPPPVYQSVLFGGAAPERPNPGTARPHGKVPSAPAPPQPVAVQVEILRGGKREVQTFPQNP